MELEGNRACLAQHHGPAGWQPPISPVLLIPMANLPPMSTTPWWQFATGINDTGSKFATVSDTGGK
jgi:hypothetical protein